MGALGAVAATGALVVGACTTDNGDDTHGPDIGSFPTSDGGRRTLPDGNVVEADGAPVKKDSGEEPVDEGGLSCATGTLAIVAGDDGTLTGGIQAQRKAWSTAAIAGGAAKTKPSLAPFGNGFLGVVHGAGDALQTFSSNGATWTAASALGTPNVKGSPTLAVAGAKAHVVYSAGPGGNRDFTHGIHDGTSWNAATATVGSGATLSFGTGSAGLAAIGSKVYFAENGSDNGLYARQFDGSWSTPVPVTGAGTAGDDPTTPEVAAVAGKYDLVIVYGYKEGRALAFATHEPGATAWGNPDTQYISGGLTAEKFSLGKLSDTELIVAFRGQDNNAYYTQGTVGADGVTWTAPAAIGGGAAIAVDSTPAVAKGICGDDAVFALASGGAIQVTRLAGSTWSAPTAVAGLQGSRVAIASR